MQLGQDLSFYDIIYSIAGTKDNDKLKRKIEGIKRELLTEEEYLVLEYILAAYKENQQFPTYVFLEKRFPSIKPQQACRNLTDFSIALKELLNARRADIMKRDMTVASLKERNPEKIAEELGKIVEANKYIDGEKIKGLASLGGRYLEEEHLKGGIVSGVKVIDALTGGFQPGLVAAIAAFTSHGKSTMINNMAYVAALSGKKIAVVSLEITKEVCYNIYLSRHTYESSMPIQYQNLIRKELTKEEKNFMFKGEKSMEQDFLEKIGKNLLLIDTSDIEEYTEAGIHRLYEHLEESMGGLDMVAWDHVNMFAYVNPREKLSGDHYINMLVNVGKKYKNREGKHPVTVFAVQTNRDGYKKAKRRDGEYDMTAISEFHEIERSATYVIFLFAEKEDLLNGKVAVQMVKHRIGATMIAPVKVYAAPGYSLMGDNFTDLVEGMSDSAVDSLFGTMIGSDLMSAGIDINDIEGVQKAVKKQNLPGGLNSKDF